MKRSADIKHVPDNISGGRGHKPVPSCFARHCYFPTVSEVPSALELSVCRNQKRALRSLACNASFSCSSLSLR